MFFLEAPPVEIEFKMNSLRIHDRNVSFLSYLHALDAEFGTNSGSDCIRMMPHERFGLGFDHDPRQRFSTAIADDDATRVRKLRLCSANSGSHSRNALERLLFANFNIDDDLRKDLQVGDEFRQRPATTVNDIKQQ
jgi:hypothetical protein